MRKTLSLSLFSWAIKRTIKDGFCVRSQQKEQHWQHEKKRHLDDIIHNKQRQTQNDMEAKCQRHINMQISWILLHIDDFYHHITFVDAFFHWNTQCVLVWDISIWFEVLLFSIIILLFSWYMRDNKMSWKSNADVYQRNEK